MIESVIERQEDGSYAVVYRETEDTGEQIGLTDMESAVLRHMGKMGWVAFEPSDLSDKVFGLAEIQKIIDTFLTLYHDSEFQQRPRIGYSGTELGHLYWALILKEAHIPGRIWVGSLFKIPVLQNGRIKRRSSDSEDTPHQPRYIDV